MKRWAIHTLIGIYIIGLVACKKDTSYETGNPGGNVVSGSFHAKIDGTQWNADSIQSATVIAGLINITGISHDNQMITINVIGQAPGTYALTQQSSSYAAYNLLSNGTVTNSYSTQGSSDPAQSGGSISFSSIDTIKKTISGTFYFNGFSTSDNTKKVITEGVFTDIHYSSTLPPAKLTDTFKVDVNDTVFVSQSILASLTAGQLVIAGSTLDGSKSVGLYMPGNITPGDYTLDAFGGTYIGQYSPNPNTLMVSKGIGTLTILENDAVARRIKGNFFFTAADIPDTMTAAISNGYFSVGY